MCRDLFWIFTRCLQFSEYSGLIIVMILLPYLLLLILDLFGIGAPIWTRWVVSLMQDLNPLLFIAVTCEPISHPWVYLQHIARAVTL